MYFIRLVELNLIIVVVSSILNNIFAEGKPNKDPDQGKRTPQFIKSNGYPLETHKIITDDGYILKYFRIPHGKSGSKVERKNKPSILLMHALMTSSAVWFIQPEPTALPFLLANAGYDVWLGNSRGTSYCRGHTNSTYDSKKNVNIYWSFSWEQLGRYDVPAAIDYILKVTGKEKIVYLGHSQGTTQFFTMLSLRPEYNKKIHIGIMYAPIVFMGNILGPFRLAGPIVEAASVSSISGILTSEFGVGKLVPDKILKFANEVAPEFCEPALIKYGICGNALFAFAGFDFEQAYFSRLNVALSQVPDQTSAMSLIHYGQSIGSNRFAQYDFGVALNAIKYHELTLAPPDFDLSLVTVPVALYNGRNDFLSQKVDVQRLTKILPNIVKNYVIPYKKWNHVDYVLGLNASIWLYQPTIKFLDRFLGQNNY